MNLIPVPCVALVTDRSRCCDALTLDQVVEQAVAGGVNLIQLREKDLPGRPLLGFAHRLREVTSGKAMLFVNERVDVAMIAGADGVHIPEDGLQVQDVRSIAGDKLLIGRSVHSVEAALRAELEGAAFLVVGTIFPTSSKSSVPVGPDLVALIAGTVNIPLLGIGGIDENNAGQVIQAGGHGVAVVSAIMDRADPFVAAKKVRMAVEEAWELHSQAAG